MLVKGRRYCDIYNDGLEIIPLEDGNYNVPCVFYDEYSDEYENMTLDKIIEELKAKDIEILYYEQEDVVVEDSYCSYVFDDDGNAYDSEEEFYEAYGYHSEDYYCTHDDEEEEYEGSWFDDKYEDALEEEEVIEILNEWLPTTDYIIMGIVEFTESYIDFKETINKDCVQRMLNDMFYVYLKDKTNKDTADKYRWYITIEDPVEKYVYKLLENVDIK